MNITSLDIDLGSPQDALAQASGAVVGFNIVLAIISYCIGRAYNYRSKNNRKKQSRKLAGVEEADRLLMRQ